MQKIDPLNFIKEDIALTMEFGKGLHFDKFDNFNIPLYGYH